MVARATEPTVHRTDIIPPDRMLPGDDRLRANALQARHFTPVLRRCI